MFQVYFFFGNSLYCATELIFCIIFDYDVIKYLIYTSIINPFIFCGWYDHFALSGIVFKSDSSRYFAVSRGR